MDSINVEKIQALRKYKEQQFVSNLLFYPLATLTFGVFCTSPFWFPSLYSSSKALVCVSIPRILSLFLSAKSLFILGNLIVIFLLRESKVRLSDASYNNKNGDKLVKPILPKTGSKKVKLHTIRKKEPKVLSSNPLCYRNNDRDSVKLTLPSTKSEEVKMHAVVSQTNKVVVPEVPLERVFANPYSTGKIDEIRYVKENARYKSSSEVEDQTREEPEEVTLWQVEERRETGGEDETKVRNEKKENSKNKDQELVIQPSTTDELKKRADDFIAMVNMQIRIEAEDELFDAC